MAAILTVYILDSRTEYSTEYSTEDYSPATTVIGAKVCICTADVSGKVMHNPLFRGS